MESAATPVAQVHHTGLTVGDLRRSIAFYCENLGFREIAVVRLEGEAISEQTGLPGTVMDVAILAGTNTVLELLAYVTPEQRPEPPRPWDVGAAHVCVIVDDIHAWCTMLRDRGVALHARPRRLMEDETTMVYLRDPDGIIVELLEPSAATALSALLAQPDGGPGL